MYITHGSGHHSAALAIEKAIRALKPDQEIININGLSYSYPIIEKIIHFIYMAIIKKAPHIWDSIYDNPVFAAKISNIKNAIHRNNRHKIEKLVKGQNCKVVICSQAFPCGLVADYKKYSKDPIKLIAVVTDFMPHSYWIYDEIDFYVVGSIEAKELLLNKGVEENKIKLFGIPVDTKFSRQADRKALLEELKISATMPNILIMGGGRGLGRIRELINNLDRLLLEVNLLVVAGRNKGLFNYLKNVKSKHRIHCYGFVDYIDNLMAVSDILVTKPGGITTAEALAKGLPMLIVNPLPGQEQNNTNFLLKNGIAYKAEDVNDTVAKLNYFLKDKLELVKMKQRIANIAKPNSSLNIAELALSLC
jgi:processive 1,2-diacylglycerol beta-glucosyltransferase